MNSTYLDISTDENAIARITLNRPEIHNAVDDVIIQQLTKALLDLETNNQVRVVVLTGAGKSFSAGADINWMRRMADYSDEENLNDAKGLAKLLHVLARLSKPTIARVNGAAFGGGVGLISACDVAVGVTTSKYSLSEVRLGIIPSAISPFVLRAIGERQAARYMVNGELFDAATAYRIGLIHEICEINELDSVVNRLAGEYLKAGPKAIHECKQLIQDVSHKTIDDTLLTETASRIARVRATDEAREGLSSFLEKRPPSWLKNA